MLRTRRAIRAESLRYSVPGHFRGYDRKMTCPRSTKRSLSTPFGPHPFRYIRSRNPQSERTYEKLTPPRSCSLRRVHHGRHVVDSHAAEAISSLHLVRAVVRLQPRANLARRARKVRRRRASVSSVLTQPRCQVNAPHAYAPWIACAAPAGATCERVRATRERVRKNSLLDGSPFPHETLDATSPRGTRQSRSPRRGEDKTARRTARGFVP